MSPFLFIFLLLSIHAHTQKTWGCATLFSLLSCPWRWPLRAGRPHEACAEHTNTAAAVLGKLLANPLTPSMVAGNQHVCQDNYSDTLDNIEQAKTALAAGHKVAVNIMISAALSDYDTCEDGFSELPSTASPLASYYYLLSKIASNCLAIDDLV